MGYNDAQIELIDQRIGAHDRALRRAGTMVVPNANTYDTTCVVRVDGSSQAVPAKILAGVLARADDRVVLDRYGDEWVVTGSFVNRLLGADAVETVFSSGTTTSGTFGDLPSSPTCTIWKHFDDTRLLVRATLTAKVVTNIGSIQVGASVDGAAGVNVAYLFFDTTTLHLSFSGETDVSGIDAGAHTIVAQWRREAGTGTPTVDVNDRFWMAVQEITP